MRRLFLRKLLLLCAIMSVLSFAGAGIVWGSKKTQQAKESVITIVTSFEPMYVAALNLVDGIDGIQVKNLTQNHTGCLHDYQMTTKDRRTLDKADIFLINGAEMEHVFEDVIASYQDLTVIDSSEGISLLPSLTHHDHEHEEEGVNGHIWLDIWRYRQQLDNIKKAFEQFDPEHEEQYEENYQSYDREIQQLIEQAETLSSKLNKENVVIFHEGFAYLAQSLGLSVVGILDMDEDTSMSAGELAKVIEEIKVHHVAYLWAEEQFKDSVVTKIAQETGAKILVLSALTSESDKAAYRNGMEENFKTIQTEMLSEER